MPAPRERVVPNCFNQDQVAPRYFITADEHIKNIWLKRINNPSLFKHPRSILRVKVVCGYHCLDVCKAGGKQRKFVLPVLNLPDFIAGDNLEESCFPFQLKPQTVLAAPP